MGSDPQVHWQLLPRSSKAVVFLDHTAQSHRWLPKAAGLHGKGRKATSKHPGFQEASSLHSKWLQHTWTPSPPTSGTPDSMCYGGNHVSCLKWIENCSAGLDIWPLVDATRWNHNKTYIHACMHTYINTYNIYIYWKYMNSLWLCRHFPVYRFS